MWNKGAARLSHGSRSRAASEMQKKCHCPYQQHLQVALPILYLILHQSTALKGSPQFPSRSSSHTSGGQSGMPTSLLGGCQWHCRPTAMPKIYLARTHAANSTITQCPDTSQREKELLTSSTPRAPYLEAVCRVT